LPPRPPAPGPVGGDAPAQPPPGARHDGLIESPVRKGSGAPLGTPPHLPQLPAPNPWPGLARRPSAHRRRGAPIVLLVRTYRNCVTECKVAPDRRNAANGDKPAGTDGC